MVMMMIIAVFGIVVAAAAAAADDDDDDKLCQQFTCIKWEEINHNIYDCCKVYSFVLVSPIWPRM